jgi:DNA-binding NtrC family response regulator
MHESSKFGARNTYLVCKAGRDAANALPPTVLFVSNEDVLRARVRVLLESEGIRVFGSADVQCASELLFCARCANVLVVDENSLGEGALEVASKLSRGSPCSAVMILTGPLTPAEVYQSIHVRGWKVLRHPLPLSNLHSAIQRALDGHDRPSRRGSRFRFRKSAKILAFQPTASNVRPLIVTSQKRGPLTLVGCKEED